MPITSDPPSPSYRPCPRSCCRCCRHRCFRCHPPPFLVDCCMLSLPTIICAAAVIAATTSPLSPLLPSPSLLLPLLSCTTRGKGGEVAIAVVVIVLNPQRHLLKWVRCWWHHPYPLRLPPPASYPPIYVPTIVTLSSTSADCCVLRSPMPSSLPLTLLSPPTLQLLLLL